MNAVAVLRGSQSMAALCAGDVIEAGGLVEVDHAQPLVWQCKRRVDLDDGSAELEFDVYFREVFLAKVWADMEPDGEITNWGVNS